MYRPARTTDTHRERSLQWARVRGTTTGIPSLRPEKATPRASKKDHLGADLTLPPAWPLLG